jgi:hypothetical protein
MDDPHFGYITKFKTKTLAPSSLLLRNDLKKVCLSFKILFDFI